MTELVGQAQARILIEKRILTNIRLLYKNKINKIKSYLAQFHPAGLNEDGSIRVPMDTNVVIACFGRICNKNQVGDEGQVMLVPSTIGGYRSALKDLYKQHKLQFPQELEVELSSILAGTKRAVAELKQKGKMKIFEGKCPLSLSGYRLLCRKFVTLQREGRVDCWNQGIFAWSYLIFSWNLIARSITTGDIYLQHISWNNDSMVITVPTTKSDKEGSREKSFHVYANPLEPLLCPILALAVLILCQGHREESRKFQVFEGEHSEKRFSECLNSMVKRLTESEAMLLGGMREDIGTHSIRKGAATYCLGMEGPNPVMVYLRAGWSLGNVQNRYIFSCKLLNC